MRREPYLADPDVTLYHGDCLDVLRQLPPGSVHMCATSPPFYGLRDYGTGEWEGGNPDCDHRESGTDRGARGELPNPPAGWAGRAQGQPHTATCGKCGARRVDQQIGLEETPDMWVDRLVQVFREVRRVLRDDGTLWVEIGDSYARAGGWSSNDGLDGMARGESGRAVSNISADGNQRLPNGYKQKDLIGQPWLLAFALRADGWYLRSEIIWARPNPMPESVTDRPTKSHSTVFLLSKRPRYFYDADAIREPTAPSTLARAENGYQYGGAEKEFPGRVSDVHRGNLSAGHFSDSGANARSVWQIPTEPTPYAHFATWPQALVRRMILAGSSEGGVVLDPFAGSATTMLVARNHGRHSIGIELNQAYLEIAARRLQQLSLLA